MEMKDRFDAWQDQLDRIEKCLVGDEPMGNPGVVRRLAKNEQAVADIQAERKTESDQRKGAIWVISAVATAASALGAFITWALSLPH